MLWNMIVNDLTNEPLCEMVGHKVNKPLYRQNGRFEVRGILYLYGVSKKNRRYFVIDHALYPYCLQMTHLLDFVTSFYLIEILFSDSKIKRVMRYSKKFICFIVLHIKYKYKNTKHPITMINNHSLL